MTDISSEEGEKVGVNFKLKTNYFLISRQLGCLLNMPREKPSLKTRLVNPIFKVQFAKKTVFLNLSEKN